MAIFLKDVKREELKIINKRRKRTGHPYLNISHKLSGEDEQNKCDTLIGLALSGGGVRSAATNLGLLQGLSERGILSGIDYISTVSGGSYIGACLSSLLSNNTKSSTSPYDFKDDLEKGMFSTRWSSNPFREDILTKDEDPLSRDQISYIRTRGSYLIPRAMYFSTTVIRAIGSVFMSTFMTILWFTLIVFFATSLYMTVVSLIVPNLKISPVTKSFSASKHNKITNIITLDENQAIQKLRVTIDNEQVPEKINNVKIITYYATKPFEEFAGIKSSQPWKLGGIIFIVGVLIFCLGSRDICFYLGKNREQSGCVCWFLKYILLLISLRLGASAFQLVYSIPAFKNGANLVVPPLFTGGALFGTCFAYILFSRNKGWITERRNEHHRLMGFLVIGFLFTLVCAVLPGFINIGIGWCNTMLLVVLGMGIKYAMSGEKDKSLKIWGALSLPAKYKNGLMGLFILLFFFLAVVYAGNVIREFGMKGSWPASSGISPLIRTVIFSLISLLVFSRLVDVNKISPHYFYRDRLSETFLKTRRSQKPKNDMRNDMKMKLSDLHGNEKNKNDQKTGKCAARGPYLLINATLNLTASQNLKAFNRKSDSFTFSRLFVGPVQKRFMRTNEYKVDDGELKLARVIAISGAAVSSLMGMNSTPVQSFACTVLGVRLGYWLPNFPKQYQPPPKKQYGANFWCNFSRLFKELVGYSTDTGKEIYLSDGGHSGDNLGIIPLLQRRVKLLIVSDSECDPHHFFNSFNNSVRNAYVDEGVQIKISLDGLRKKNKNGLTQDKFAVGRIIYPEDRKQESWLVLFKNTMTGKDISTIVNYKEKNNDFPHENTGDQFFIEEQFEAYRALGRFSIFDVFENHCSWMDACKESSPTISPMSRRKAFNFLNGLIKKYSHETISTGKNLYNYTYSPN
jgi:hypothetical protein